MYLTCPHHFAPQRLVCHFFCQSARWQCPIAAAISEAHHRHAGGHRRRCRRPHESHRHTRCHHRRSGRLARPRVRDSAHAATSIASESVATQKQDDCTAGMKMSAAYTIDAPPVGSPLHAKEVCQAGRTFLQLAAALLKTRVATLAAAITDVASTTSFRLVFDGPLRNRDRSLRRNPRFPHHRSRFLSCGSGVGAGSDEGCGHGCAGTF